MPNVDQEQVTHHCRECERLAGELERAWAALRRLERQRVHTSWRTGVCQCATCLAEWDRTETAQHKPDCPFATLAEGEGDE
jgi:hypothetical protein